MIVWLLLFMYCSAMPEYVIPLPSMDVCERTRAVLDDVAVSLCWTEDMRQPQETECPYGPN